MFMIRVLLGLLMGLFLTMGVARAENWYLLGETKNFKHSIDLDSIRVVDGRVRYWTRLDYASVQHGSHGSYVVVRNPWIGDCRERISALNGAVNYDTQGQVIKTSSFRDDIKYHDVTPGSVGETQFDFACAWTEGLRLPVGRNWEVLDKTSFHVDVDSPRTVNGWTMVWVKISLKSEENPSTSDFLAYGVVDCAQQRSATIWAGLENESIHLKPRSRSEWKWKFDKDGSIGKAICARMSSPAALPKSVQPKTALPGASAAG